MGRSVLAGAFLAAMALASADASAQTATGQITGSVRDSSGAVMSKVKVVVTNTQTGLTRETTTNDAGDYVVPLLPVGVYIVTGEQAGFKTALRTDLTLNVDQVQRVDLQLDAGNVSETVEVRSAAVALDTASASIGHNITATQVTELPLNGRNFLQLLFLGAGAVETGGEQAAMRQGVGNAISIMGARPTSNNYMLDGTANTDTSLGTPAAVLSVDAIEEFKEQTTTYSAEYGFSSNQINIVSKSGSNRLKGTAFGFFRNEGLDARNFFDPGGAEKPKLDQKQFGFVVGGPVYLPFYDGRNKSFFLVNYEGTRIERGSNAFYTVPTPEQLAGRFSTTIIDPWTGQPFPNNTIPQSRFARTAQLALRNGWYPAPNSTAAQGNYQAVRTLPQNADQFTLRGDQDLGNLGRVMGRFTKSTYTNRTNSNLLEIGDRRFEQDTTNWQVSHTLPFRNNLVNQFRIGRVDARADQAGIPCPQSDVDFLQLTGIFTGIPDIQRECPQIGIQGYSGTGGAGNAYSASNQPMWDMSNATTWISGNHTFNFGFSYRRWWLQRDLATGFLGGYGYNLPGFTGDPVADMLLGVYSSVGVFQPAAYSVPGVPGNPREFNFKYFAPYVQDDWKVNSRLTVNLGLRWDYRNVPYETRNRMAWRNLDYPLGGLLVADQSLVDGGIADGGYYQYAGARNPENPDRFKVFAPRLGFAWRPFGEDTVLRGGYGVFYDSAEGREIDGAADVYPYVSRGNYIQSVGQVAPLQTSDTLFPSFAAPGVATPEANTFLAVSQSPQPRNPYMQQWSLGIQRELFANTTLELNYIGTKGTNLLMRQNVAQALPYSPEHPTVAERKPYPNFVVYIDSTWAGRSNYNAFNTKLEHRGRGALLTFAYTWAKSTDTKSAAAGIGATGYNGWQGFLDNSDPDRDHGLSDFDVDHRLVGSFVYNLPFGSGEKYAGDSTGIKEAIVGGWQLNGIYTWQRGFPLTIQAADLGGLNDGFGANRADLVGDPSVSNPSLLGWFNTAAFAQPAAGSYGTSGRNILRGPGVNNIDLALFKNFAMVKGTRLQFRLESFNAFNHTQFNSVSTSLTSSTFGVVNGARAGRINQLGLKFIF